MQVMAYTGKDFLLSATKDEILSIMSALCKRAEEVKIGDRIPAYDYAALIQACKAFKNSYAFKEFKTFQARLNKEATKIISEIETLEM